jgi:hypothetical protein
MSRSINRANLRKIREILNRGPKLKPDARKKPNACTQAAMVAARFRASWGKGTRKQLGELAEMMFMVKASIKGMVVAKPYGETQRYDFLVDSGKRTWRVQVKSSSCTHWRAFTVNAYWKTTRKHLPYLPSKVDFLAVAILGTDIWYLIPVRALAGRLMVRVYPFGGDPRGSRRFEKYRDAWHLLNPKKQRKSRIGK